MKAWLIVLLLLGACLVGCGRAAEAAMGPPLASPSAGRAEAPREAAKNSKKEADSDSDGIPDTMDKCSAGSGAEDGCPGPERDAAKAAADPTAKPTAPEAVHRVALLVYTAHLTLAVFQVEAGLANIEKLGNELGGYLSAKSDREITIRIPRERFPDAIARIEKQGDVVHRELSAEDVTDEYFDMDARLKNARAMRDRLQQLLQNAQVKDAIEIEKELGRVTGEIEVLEGKLKLLKDRIAYSTITVTFQAIDASPVHDLARLPYPWLRDLGLSQLLRVTEVR